MRSVDARESRCTIRPRSRPRDRDYSTAANFDPFGILPRRWMALLQQARVSRLALLVLWDLATYADKSTGVAFPSIQTLADDVGATVRAVKAAIAELKAIPGILTVQRRNRRAAAPGQRSNMYTLTVPADARRQSAVRRPVAASPGGVRRANDRGDEMDAAIDAIRQRETHHDTAPLGAENQHLIEAV